MPAKGFVRVEATDIGPEHYGRIWRVNFQEEGSAVSNGNKGVVSLVLSDTGIHVEHSDRSGARYGLDHVESILVEEETPEQRTLARWSR